MGSLPYRILQERIPVITAIHRRYFAARASASEISGAGESIAPATRMLDASPLFLVNSPGGFKEQ
jgi:hypothetical protein